MTLRRTTIAITGNSTSLMGGGVSCGPDSSPTLTNCTITGNSAGGVDAVFGLRYLFTGGPAPPCMKSLDVDDDGRTNLTDPVSLLNYLFRRGPRPAEPFGDCGVDPTADSLSCESFISCQ